MFHTTIVLSSDFYDTVLCSYSLHSIFVLVDIESDEYDGKAIIENGDLFEFLNQTKGFDKKQYKSFMKDLLSKNSKLSLEKSELNKWHFIKIQKIKSVENITSKGKDDFIAQYFNGNVIKKGIDLDERNAVIATLFQWRIASLVDDETGYLILIRINENDTTEQYPNLCENYE